MATRQQQLGADAPTPVDPHEAVTALKAALSTAGIALPSLWVECPPVDDVYLIKLGSVRPDVVMKLAAVMTAEMPLPSAGVPMWCERMRHVGEVVGVSGSRVTLRPLNGGRSWQSSPSDLRYARVSEIRALLLAFLNEEKRRGE